MKTIKLKDFLKDQTKRAERQKRGIKGNFTTMLDSSYGVKTDKRGKVRDWESIA